MLPINVAWDSGLSPFEQDCVTEGMLEFKEAFPGRRVVIVGSRQWSIGNYSSADWYIRQTKAVQRNYNGLQLDADILLGLMMDNPRQKTEPFVDVLITSYDLASKGPSDRFGTANGRIVVQSVARYGRLSFADRRMVIKTTIWHELGHVFGLTEGINRPNTELKFGSHCTNPGCSMCQSTSLDEKVALARKVGLMHRIYCPQCKREMLLSKN